MSRLKLSHHSHTGRKLPHHHTSYAALAFVTLLGGIVLSAISYTSFAGPHPDPQSGYVGLSGTVAAPPPKTAATITRPFSGQHFTTSPVTVSGSCPTGTLVQIFKNDIFAGAAPCLDNGTYSVDVDLLLGSNVLKAVVHDNLDQPGPDSNLVTVFYDALPPQSDPLALASFSSLQLLLHTNAVYRGVFPNQDLVIPIEIIGGRPPYAVNVEWGDGTNTLVTRSNNLEFDTRHAYKKAGTFQVVIQATDADSRVAFLTVIAIINGKTEVLSTTPQSIAPKKSLLLVWPLFAVALAMIVSFWLGEKREKHVLEQKEPPTI